MEGERARPPAAGEWNASLRMRMTGAQKLGKVTKTFASTHIVAIEPRSGEESIRLSVRASAAQLP